MNSCLLLLEIGWRWEQRDWTINLTPKLWARRGWKAQVVLWFAVYINRLISKASVFVPLLVSEDFLCPEMIQLLFQRLFQPDKNKNLEEVLNTPLGFVFLFFGHVLDVSVQLCTYIFFFSPPCVCISKIFCRACVCPLRFGTPATVFPHPFVLCCWSWVGLCEGQYGPEGWGGGGGGGLCWQAWRPDPWLRSFFRAGALAVVTGSSSRRMAVCCNTQQCVGVFVI